MKVKILTLTKKIFEGEAKEISFKIPGEEFQILKNHAPFFGVLKQGKILIDKKREIAIKKGIVSVFHNKIIILVHPQ